MEQHRVLLIIASVAVVLAAIVGVGIWLFYPRDAAPVDLAAADGRGLEWQPLDYIRGDGSLPGLEEVPAAPEPDEFEVTYGVVPEQPAAGRPSAAGRPTVSVITPDEAPRTETVTARPSTVTVPGQPAPATTAPRTAQPAAAPAPAPAPAARPAPAAAPAVTARPAPALADRAYWVQAISSPNRDTVERAQQTLREHQMGSRIMTREIGGTLYYRLRFGPFAVREEAEKFLVWVTRIDGFGDSMIFVDATTPVLVAAAAR